MKWKETATLSTHLWNCSHFGPIDGHESMFLKIIKDIEGQAKTLEIMESQMIFLYLQIWD